MPGARFPARLITATPYGHSLPYEVDHLEGVSGTMEHDQYFISLGHDTASTLPSQLEMGGAILFKFSLVEKHSENIDHNGNCRGRM